MTDADTTSTRVMCDVPNCNDYDDKRRVPVNREAFTTAFADKGCTTGQARADLLETSRRNVDKYVAGHVVPTLTTARRIASRLGRDINELWPADSDIAA